MRHSLIIFLIIFSCQEKKKFESTHKDSKISISDSSNSIEDFKPKIDSVIDPIDSKDDSVMHSFIHKAQLQKDAPGDNNPYISDVESISNIDRPSRTYIKDPSFAMNNIFGVWGGNGDEPVSDFRIDAKEFDVADYEGNSNMPYILYGDSLLVFYNDFIRHGKILYSTKDSLSIRWRSYENEYDQGYVRWR